jgi:hypothetical protein
MTTTQEVREQRKQLNASKSKQPMGCFVWLFLLGAIVFISYLAINDKSTENARAEQQMKGTKWSESAVQSSKNRVAKWVSLDQIKLDLANNEVYIAPLFWNSCDFAQKKEMVVTLIVYQDVEAGKDDNPITILDKQTGKELASWNSLSDFDFK